MNIQPLKNNISFKGATININAISDTHGHIELADNAYQSLMAHDAFEKEEDGKANFLIVAGDWFISGSKKGYLSNPKKTYASFQNKILNFFIHSIKKKFPNLKTLFIPGNHDFDSNIETLVKTINDSDAQYIMTNLDYSNNNSIHKLFDEGKIVQSRVDFVTDDKDKSKKHAVLNLGIIPINLQYYQNNYKDINLIENVKIPQHFVEAKHFEKTKQATIKEIEKFKRHYKDGTVILTCHTGCGFADAMAEEADIDLILNAHEHKEYVRYINNTPIVELGQNFKRMANVKIIKDDEGNRQNVRIECFNPAQENYSEGKIAKLYKLLFKKDFKKIYSIKSTDENIKELDIKGIRQGNNNLANVVVDIILKSIQELDKSVQIFAFNASSIRGGFNLEGKKNVSNYELLNCLGGIKEEEAEIYTNEVTGQELCLMILEEYLFNMKDTEKNPIIHYAGLKIDKTNLLEYYKKGMPYNQFIRLSETNEPIDLDKTYKIANVEKFFLKSRCSNKEELKACAQKLNLNALDAFSNYFKKHNSYTFEPEVRVY